ncbi:hypothetical protein ACHAWF_011861, partial [Thalassiosira exigua]
ASLLSRNDAISEVVPTSIGSLSELGSSISPTSSPSVRGPTTRPTGGSKEANTKRPSKSHTMPPAMNPVTDSPTQNPTQSPPHITTKPTEGPTEGPVEGPSGSPSQSPTHNPTKRPTTRPTLNPTKRPTLKPTPSAQSPDNELIATEDILYHNSTRSVSVHGKTVVVDAPENENHGVAFVFVKDIESGQWSQHAKLEAPDGAEGGRFGWSVAVYEGTIIVGSYRDDDNGENSGSAHVFVQDGATWTHQAKLLDPNRDAFDYFGKSAELHDGTVIVGACGDDDNGNRSGSAHVFVGDGTTWTHQAKLLAPDGDVEDLFGAAVAVFGDTVIVCAENYDHNGVDSGSCHIYVRRGSEWYHQEKLLAPDGAAGDMFGVNAGIYDNTVVVGASDDDDHGSNSGSAHIYTRIRSEWSHQAKLVAPDAANGDIFGNSIGIYGDTVVAGAWGDNGSDLSSGSAYVYTFGMGQLGPTRPSYWLPLELPATSAAWRLQCTIALLLLGAWVAARHMCFRCRERLLRALRRGAGAGSQPYYVLLALVEVVRHYNQSQLKKKRLKTI